MKNRARNWCPVVNGKCPGATRGPKHPDTVMLDWMLKQCAWSRKGVVKAMASERKAKGDAKP